MNARIDVSTPPGAPADEPVDEPVDGPVDEPVEWLDDDGRVCAIVPRSVMRRDNLLHRSVAVVVRSSDGRLLVHRRADTKDLLPGWWDVCAGGVARVDEDARVGARRELGEELGVDVGPDDLRLLGTGGYDDEYSRERTTLFEVVHDGPFRFADGEVTEARFVTVDELVALMQLESFLPTCTALVLPLVDGFSHLADPLE